MRRISRASRRWRTARHGRALRAMLGVVVLSGSTLLPAAAVASAASAAPMAAPAAAAGTSYVTTGFSPTGGGWQASAGGHVSAFGGESVYGTLDGTTLNRPIVAMASTPDGRGYWLVASDGGIFSFGDAAFHGSTGNIRLNQPIVGMAATPDGQGYWLVASDGGIFTFGDAPFYGSEGGQTLSQPAIGMAPMPGGGYSIIAADASYQAFGPSAAPAGTTTITTTPTATTITTVPSATTTAPSTTTTTTAPVAVPATSASTSTTAPTLGVLAAVSSHIATDKAAGVKLATIVLSWNQFEPTQNQWGSSYISYVQGIANQYRAAGMRVAIDPGLQHPPAWATALPNGKYVDQNGTSSYLADFAWSQDVRNAGSAYLKQLVASMGPVVDYRVGSSENGETMLPGTSTNQWWAYTPDAQGKASGLPGNLTASPMPGWVPGTATWNGQPVTVAMATNWYNWYFSGAWGSVAWEINAYHNAGYTGQLELVMPGMGSLPTMFNQRLNSLLADGKTTGQHYDDYYTLNTGAVWWKLLSDLPVLGNVAVDVSSVDDVSGSPRANGCTASDASVPYTSSAIWSWSDTRWLAYLAHAHGLPIMGENPGNTPAANLPAIMNLVHSCNLTALQWAWDSNLYANDGSATLAQLQSAFFGS